MKRRTLIAIAALPAVLGLVGLWLPYDLGFAGILLAAYAAIFRTVAGGVLLARFLTVFLWRVGRKLAAAAERWAELTQGPRSLTSPVLTGVGWKGANQSPRAHLEPPDDLLTVPGSRSGSTPREDPGDGAAIPAA